MTRLIYSLIAFMLALQLSPATADPYWAKVDVFSFSGRKASVVTIEPSVAKVRIVSVPFEVNAITGGHTDVSLRVFSQFLERSHPQYKNSEWIAVNGGFSSFRLDVPLGLLIVDGKVYSQLSKERAKAGYDIMSPHSGQLRWSGVLCKYKETKKWDIIFAAKYQPGQCEEALQAGPFLVEPDSQIAISPKESQRAPYTRTAVCITTDQRMRFVLTLDDTHLFPLAQWLGRAESEGGLGCRVALNLSGDTSSGIAIREKKKEPIFLGNGVFPLPTALIIESNK